MLQSIEKFSKYPSIINTKNRKSYSNCTFSFKFETQEKIRKLIHNLDCNKGTQQYDIPINLLKEIVRFSHTYYTTTSIILYLIVFPNSPKKADITPVFKKDEKF